LYSFADFAGASTLYAKNDVHDGPHFTELLWVQVVGYFDVFVVRPDDLKGAVFGGELNEPETEMARVGIVIVGFDVADATIIFLKLTLNEHVGLIGSRQIKVIVAGSSASKATWKYSSPASLTET